MQERFWNVSYKRSRRDTLRGTGCVDSIKRKRKHWLDIILSDSFRSRPTEGKNGPRKSGWSNWSTVSTAESGQPRFRVGISSFSLFKRYRYHSRERKSYKKCWENDAVLFARWNWVICHNNSRNKKTKLINYNISNIFLKILLLKIHWNIFQIQPLYNNFNNITRCYVILFDIFSKNVKIIQYFNKL